MANFVCLVLLLSIPASVLFESPVLTDLIRLPGVHDLVCDVIDELLDIAASQECKFPSNFRQNTIQSMLDSSSQDPSTMYQDFMARRPMEVETYLGSPVELAKAANLRVLRLETLYTLLRHVNTVNRDRPAASSAPRNAAVPVNPPATPSNHVLVQSSSGPTTKWTGQWGSQASARTSNGSSNGPARKARSSPGQWLSRTPEQLPSARTQPNAAPTLV